MKCSVEGCELPAKSKGLCFKHYMRLRRTGKLTTERRTGDFWSKVDRSEPLGCWPWQGFAKETGHGLTSIKGRPTYTSRKAWILTHGPIQEGLHVLHKCDNPLCCNPNHLYLGTPQDNIIDTFTRRPFEERGRGTRPCLLTEEQLTRLWRMRRYGATIKACAEAFDVHHTTIVRYITRMRLEKIKKLQAVRLSKPDLCKPG